MYSLVIVFACFMVKSLLLNQFAAGSELSSDSLRQASRCPADAEKSWSYSGSNGPLFWGDTYPDCDGANQSPIRIDSNKVIRDQNRTVYFQYHQISGMNATMKNTGYTIELTHFVHFLPRIYWKFEDWSDQYSLYSVEFHWGRVRTKGSEHIIDGVQYTMEMHIIHKTLPLDTGGTAIVVVFFQQGDGINADLQHIVNELPKVMYKDMETWIPYTIDIFNLIPKDKDPIYYYEGSLTSPNCTEGIHWFVTRTPVLIGTDQIRAFRGLFSTTQDQASAGCKITNNLRPVHKLHGRKVYAIVGTEE